MLFFVYAISEYQLYNEFKQNINYKNSTKMTWNMRHDTKKMSYYHRT